MPTIRKMLEKFIEANHGPDMLECQTLVLGDKKYSLSNQEEVKRILDKNIIKTTNKEIYNSDIAESMKQSVKKNKGFKDKVFSKVLFKELAEYLNNVYGFNISVDDVVGEIIGTAEERHLYILRETERENYGGEPMKLKDIADKIGCSPRLLQKDVQQITQQGFKLLGQNIKLIDEDQNDNLLKLDSTPHPVILMQNISQLLVMLEGLRSMEEIEAYRNYAHFTALNIWNQLTEYSQDKIIDAVDNMDIGDKAMNWYTTLEYRSKSYNRFVTEAKNSEGNPSSQLMYLCKNECPFHINYKNEENENITLFDCNISYFNPTKSEVKVISSNEEYQLDIKKIIHIEII